MANMAYNLFMAEAENRFPDQREASLNAVVRDLVDIYNGGGSIDESIDAVLEAHNLTNISPYEEEYIGEAFISRIG